MRFARVLQCLLLLACLGIIFAVQTGVRAADTPVVFNVNTTADEIDGTCNSTHCSLREAINAANAIPLINPTPTINLIAGTYTLTLTGSNEDQTQTGDLDIWRSMNLRTNGAVIDGNNTDRIFDVQYGKLDLQDLTLQHGTADLGGAIRVRPDADLDPQNSSEVYLSGNRLDISQNTAQEGGAIYLEANATLNIVDVFQNESLGSGAIATAGVGGFGLSQGAVVNNIGSGLWLESERGGPQLTNVTISGNTGYGIFERQTFSPNGDTLMLLIHVTIANNALGGLFAPSEFQDRVMTVGSILAHNGPDGLYDCGYLDEPDTVMIISSFYNIIKDDVHCDDGLLWGPSPYNPSPNWPDGYGANTSLMGIDPLLENLGVNASGTLTHALQANSHAIGLDKEHCTWANGTDQRSVLRNNEICDAGAFESDLLGEPQTAPFIVNWTYDEDDGVCSSNHCTLREAINAANLHPNGTQPDQISFNVQHPAFGIAVFESTSPLITDPIVIDGTTQPVQTVSIRSNGVTTIDGLTITAGGSTLRGLEIAGFRNGVVLQTGGGNTLLANNITGHTNSGLRILNSANNQIGDATAANSNAFQTNGTGILLEGAGSTGNQIEGNFIGVDRDGVRIIGPYNRVLGNTYGIAVRAGAHDNQIGSAENGTFAVECAGGCNLISGNTTHQILVESGANNRIQGNYIGLDQSGERQITASGLTLLIKDTTDLGGPTFGQGNVIAGMVRFQNGGLIQGNYFNINDTATSAPSNSGSGWLDISGSTPTIVGGLSSGAGNVIGMFGGSTGISTNTAYVTIQGNFIGISPQNVILGTQRGTAIFAARSNNVDYYPGSVLIGGIEPGAGNTIANVKEGVVDSYGGIRFLGNSIAAPSELVGGTMPVLHWVEGAVNERFSGSVSHQGIEPSDIYRIEVFENEICEYNHPQNIFPTQHLIAVSTITASRSGLMEFDITIPEPLPLGHSVTVTVTHMDSYTYAISRCLPAHVTEEPTEEPTPEITPEPTPELTPEPTVEVTVEPTEEPTPIGSQNLILNGDFGAGLTHWQTGGAIVSRFTDGAFEVYFNPTLGTQKPTLTQTLNESVTSNQTLELQLNLANSAPVRKRVQVALSAPGQADSLVCTFWLDAAAPWRTYTLRGRPQIGWNQMQVQLTLQTADNRRWVGVDNVQLYRDDAVVDGAREAITCTDPTAPLPGTGADSTNLIRNGGFSQDLNRWTFTGDGVSRFRNGMFEFYYPNTGRQQPTLQQVTTTSVPDNAPFEVRLWLGNRSSVRKPVLVTLRARNNSDSQQCLFWLPPNTPLGEYVMRTFSTTAFTDLTLAVQTSQRDGQGWIRLDNVTVQHRPTMAVNGTSCTPPGAGISALGSAPAEVIEPVVTEGPTVTVEPTITPTDVVTETPTAVPTEITLTVEPTLEPTTAQTDLPTLEPTLEPTAVPTDPPTLEPTATPEPTQIPAPTATEASVPTDSSPAETEVS